MHIARTKKSSCQYVTPPPAQLYALTDSEDEGGWAKFKAFASGVKYTFTLALMLWWLPIIGQCVAGYIGGRRAGSPYRGLMAAALPVIIMFCIGYFVQGDPLAPENPAVIVTGRFSTTVGSTLPFLLPYLQFTTLYLGDFTAAIQDTSMMRFSAYSVVLVFAMIGGMMADQSKKEMKSVFKAVAPVEIKAKQQVWTHKSAPKKAGPSFDSMKKVKATTSKTGSAKKASSKKAAPSKTKSPAE